MIRRTLFTLLAFCGLLACQDDEPIGFDVPTEFRGLSFDPIAGGAVMRYYLPDEQDIYGVRVRYTNAWGEPQMKEGTYLADSLLIDGFTEARTNEPAQVCFFNRDMAESEPIDVTFNTQESATVSIFDNLSVNAFWGGFNVTYDAPETVNGIMHVFYVGTNPMTHQPDSILMMSTPIVEGGDTLNFVMQQVMDSVDVVVRTDNYDGKRVKQIVVEGLPCLMMDTLTSADFDFKFGGEVVESAEYEFGIEYLFDGDKNGLGRKHNLTSGNPYKYSTCVFGPNAFYESNAPLENRFIIDLKEERVPAAVNIYEIVYFHYQYPSRNPDHPLPSDVWSGYYCSRLPSKVKLYGTNEDPETVDLSTCALLYELDDDPSFASYMESWAKYADEYYSDPNYEVWGDGSYLTESDETVEAAEPVVLNMLCNYSGERYRYLIFVVEDTYDGRRWAGSEENTRQYITINELEVCVKAE